MKVNKIVVDKDQLPKGCYQCHLYRESWCWGANRPSVTGSLTIRQPYCPIVTEPYFTIKEHTHYLTVHGWDIKDNTLTVDFEVKHEV